MLYTIMRHLKNFFPAEGKDGEFKIENGTINLDGLVQTGQYFLIEGSIFNDGVYRYNNLLSLSDETFRGRVTGLRPPKDFLDLAAEISSYCASGVDKSPYTSESFGGYSYTKATTSKGGTVTWKDVFKSRLDVFRKI